MKKFFCIFLMFPYLLLSTEWYSQSNQDEYLYKRFFSKYKNGFFVELGAYDGVSISNTYAYEKHFNWDGICIEPMQEPFEALKKNRQCLCLNQCISNKVENKTFYRIHIDSKYRSQHKHAIWTEMLSGIVDEYDAKHEKRIARFLDKYHGSVEYVPLTTSTLQQIFNEHSVKLVDFLSLDTEGNELKILKGIDFNKTKIAVIAVENNYNDANISQFLKKLGYKFDRKLGCDEIYYLPSALK